MGRGAGYTPIESAQPIPRVCTYEGKPSDRPGEEPGVIGPRPCRSTNIRGPFFIVQREAEFAKEANGGRGKLLKKPMVLRTWMCADCGTTGEELFVGFAPGTMPADVRQQLIDEEAARRQSLRGRR